jgi:hypothetical protein
MNVMEAREEADLRLECLRLARETGEANPAGVIAIASRYFDFVAKGEIDEASGLLRDAQIKDAKTRLSRRSADA